MAIDFPRSTYTAAEGVSAESWPASPSNGDTQTNGAGDSFTFISARSLWVLDSGRTLTLAGGATYSWDLEKWIAQSHIPFRYFGPQSSDPTGMSASDEGDLYYNTVENEMRVFNGTAWDQVTSIGNFNILSLSQSNNAGGGSATFNGTATRFQLSETPNTAQQLLIALDGVIQEPHSGSAVPNNENGFVVVGQDIIFGEAPAANTPFWGVQMGAAVNVGTPSNGAVTNVHVNASAAIAGTKISPDFGSQDIVTTGEVGIGTTSPDASLTIEDTSSASGTKSLNVKVVDNTAEVVHVAQGANEYLSIDTTNTSELITLGNTTTKPDVVVPDGSVGIGSISPVRRLEVKVSENVDYVTDFQQDYNCLALRNDQDNKAVGLEFKIGTNGQAAIGALENADSATSLFFSTRDGNTRSEKMRLSNSGRLSIGTTAIKVGGAPGDKNGKVNILAADTGFAMQIRNDSSNGNGLFLRGGGDAATEFPLYVTAHDETKEILVVTGDEKVGIGTDAPKKPLHIHGAATAADETVRISQTSDSSVIQRMLIGFTKDAADTNPAVSIGAVEIDAADRAAGFVIGTRSANNDTAPVDRCLINSMGEFKVNARQWVTPLGGAIHQFCFNADNSTFHNGNIASIIRGNRENTPLFQGLSTSSGPTASPTERFEVFWNGDVTNANDSYGATSDAKLKENIVDAGSQWEDFKAVKFRKYNYKEDTGYETHTQLGVIAQELETVSPGLVVDKPDYDEEGNELGTVTKSVKYSVLTKKALVALQEAMARIETLESEIKALKEAQ